MEKIGFSNELTILDFTKIIQPKAYDKQLQNKKENLKLVVDKLSDLLDLKEFLEESDFIISNLDIPNQLNNSIYKIIKNMNEIVLVKNFFITIRTFKS